MPGSSRALVIGGGINGVAPLAVDEFLFVTSVTPPEASSSPRLVRRATSIEIEGDGNLSTSIGNNADANGDESIVIGVDCSQQGVGAGTNVIVIGQNNDHTGVGGTSAILIGRDTTSNGTGCVMVGQFATTPVNANDWVGIGFGLSHSGTFNGVLVGNGATSQGTQAVAIGGGSPSAASNGVSLGHGAVQATGSNQNITIGTTANSSNATGGNLLLGNSTLSSVTNVIFVGHNLRTNTGTYASGDVVIGNLDIAGLGFSSRVIWFGDIHTSGTAVPASAMRWKNAAGTNVVANDLTVTAPRATGNAQSAHMVFQVGVPGASGAVLATATTVMRLLSQAAPQVEVSRDRGVEFANQTSAAGAAVGTLTNAPAAGDPTHWLKITIGAANFAIPCWPG